MGEAKRKKYLAPDPREKFEWSVSKLENRLGAAMADYPLGTCMMALARRLYAVHANVPDPLETIARLIGTIHEEHIDADEAIKE